MHLPIISLLAMSLLDNCKLTYFGLAGRGEATRLALSIGGIQFTDERVPFPQWKELKPTTPWGSLPVLTLATGQSVAQQHAILRLVGKETGLYPTDSLKAALVDSLMDAVEDIGSKLNSQGQGLPQDEKEAARAKAVAKGGLVYGILEKVEAFIAANGSGGYSVGDSLTIADLFIFASCGTLVSGMFDGVPTDAIDKDFPNIMAVRKSVRSNTTVTEWYEKLDSSITMAPSFGPFE